MAHIQAWKLPSSLPVLIFQLGLNGNLPKAYLACNMLSFTPDINYQIQPCFQPAQWDAPYAPKALLIDMPLIGYQLKKQGILDTAARTIQNYWQTRTKKLYLSHIKRCIGYCSERDINPICPYESDNVKIAISCSLSWNHTLAWP